MAVVHTVISGLGGGLMRGVPVRQLAMVLSTSAEELIPAMHPIRRIRAVIDVVLPVLYLRSPSLILYTKAQA